MIWFNSDNKTIDVFSTVECVEPKICSGSVTFVTGDGVYVERGDISGTQTVKVQWDITGDPEVKIQEENGPGGKLCEWSGLTTDTVINVSYFKI